MTESQATRTRSELEAVREALQKGKVKRLRKLFKPMHPAKIASLLESLPVNDRVSAWEQVDEAAEEKVLNHLGRETTTTLGATGRSR